MTKQFNIYFTDRRMNILGVASPDLKLLWDKETSILSEGASVLEGIMAYNGKRFDKEASDFVKVGNYVLFENEYGESRIFTIIDSEKDRKNNEINFYAENGSLDLLNEVVQPFEAVKDMTIADYFTMYLKNSGYKIGINELGNSLNRKLIWEGSATVTERLLSIATQFDHAEIDFTFEVKGMQVKNKYINIYKKRGVATGVTLQLDKDVDNIITTESIKNLATSLYVTGSVPEGAELPITLKGYKPPNPDPRFVIEEDYLRDIESNQIWSRFLADGTGANGGYITKEFSYETLSQSELYNRAVNKLKEIAKVEQNFEVDIAVLPDNVRLGDTVRIVDQNDRLYLEARVLQLEVSRSSNDSKAILGDYLIKEDGFNEKFKELADKIASIPKGETFYPWVRYADDDKGNGFSATPAGKKYMAVKHVANQPVPSDKPADYLGLWILISGKDGKPTYTWIKYADGANGEGMTESPVPSTFFIGIAVNKLVQAESANPADYTWSKFVGEDGDPGVPGKPGNDGKPTYTWIKYADSDKGAGMSNSPVNKAYIGFAYNKNTATESNVATDYIWSLIKGADGKNGLSITSVQTLFYQSTSATSLVGGTWVTTAPVWTSGKFSWTKTKTTFSDNTTSETTPVNVTGGIGADGKQTYTWIMYAEDDKGKGINASPVGKYFIGFAYNKPVEKPSTVPADYTWSAMYDEEQMAKLQEQINNLNYVGTNLWAPNFYDKNVGYINADGSITPDTNYRYTDKVQVKGATYMTRTVVTPTTVASGFRQAYYNVNGAIIGRSDNLNTNVIGSTSTKLPTGTDSIAFYAANKGYPLQLKAELGNKATDYSISPLDTPTTGDLNNVQTELQKQLNTIVTPVIQPNTPANPKEGMIWWQNNLAGDIIGMFKYEKGKWVPQIIQQSMLNIFELNAVKITSSEMVGTVIHGSEFIATFDKFMGKSDIQKRRGILTMKDGQVTIDYEQYEFDNPTAVVSRGKVRYDDSGATSELVDSNGRTIYSSSYGTFGIEMTDVAFDRFGKVNLGYHDLMTIPESPFTSDMYATGFTQYTASADNQPRYSRNNRMVQLSGAVKNIATLQTGAALIHIATLPVGVRPMRRVNIRCQSDGMNSFMLAVMADGNMYISRFGITSYTSIPPESWLNIAVSYVAAD